MRMFKEHQDDKWLVVELILGFIEAHSGRQFGTPTIEGTRIPTYTAAGAWENNECGAYGLTKQQAFAAFCFEVGREYQRNRKLRKRIADACHEGWEQYQKEEAELEIERHKGEGI